MGMVTTLPQCRVVGWIVGWIVDSVVIRAYDRGSSIDGTRLASTLLRTKETIKLCYHTKREWDQAASIAWPSAT